MKLIKELNQRKSVEFVNINTDYSFVKLIRLIFNTSKHVLRMTLYTIKAVCVYS